MVPDACVSRSNDLSKKSSKFKTIIVINELLFALVMNGYSLVNSDKTCLFDLCGPFESLAQMSMSI